jgi:hypothetical protein
MLRPYKEQPEFDDKLFEQLRGLFEGAFDKGEAALGLFA